MNLYTKEKKNKRLDRENSILNAATEMFVTKGYELTTTKEIANLAGCAEGLIFKYFSGKQNLLHKILEKGILKSEEELINLPERLDSLEEDLCILMDWFMRIYWNQRKIFKIYYAQRLNGENGLAVSEIRESFLKKRRDLIYNRLKIHQELGHLKKDIDFDVLFYTMNSYAIYICVLFPAFSSEDTILKNLNIKSFIKNIVTGITI